MALYLDHLLPAVTREGDDSNYGSTAMYDVLALQARARTLGLENPLRRREVSQLCEVQGGLGAEAAGRSAHHVPAAARGGALRHVAPNASWDAERAAWARAGAVIVRPLASLWRRLWNADAERAAGGRRRCQSASTIGKFMAEAEHAPGRKMLSELPGGGAARRRCPSASTTANLWRRPSSWRGRTSTRRSSGAATARA